MSFSGPQRSQSFDPDKVQETEKTEHNQSSDVSHDINGETRTQVVDWDRPNDPQRSIELVACS